LAALRHQNTITNRACRGRASGHRGAPPHSHRVGARRRC